MSHTRTFLKEIESKLMRAIVSILKASLESSRSALADTLIRTPYLAVLSQQFQKLYDPKIRCLTKNGVFWKLAVSTHLENSVLPERKCGVPPQQNTCFKHILAYPQSTGPNHIPKLISLITYFQDMLDKHTPVAKKN